MSNLTIKPNKENLELLTNFFEQNKDGSFTYSEEKAKKMLEEAIKTNKNITVAS